MTHLQELSNVFDKIGVCYKTVTEDGYTALALCSEHDEVPTSYDQAFDSFTTFEFDEDGSLTSHP
jgi:hypothetical protein